MVWMLCRVESNALITNLEAKGMGWIGEGLMERLELQQELGTNENEEGPKI